MCLQGLGLCHGISGNAYAMLSAARATGRHRDQRRALKMGEFIAEHWQQLLSQPDHPLSLFEVGQMGILTSMVWFAFAVLKLTLAWPGCHPALVTGCCVSSL